MTTKIAKFLANSLQRDYDAPFLSIPGHGRYQHFAVGGRDRIAQLLSTWPTNVDNTERCRRLIDLFLVSVLLDAGAGTSWQYKSNENGRVYRRSEGIAVASLEMFKTVSTDFLSHYKMLILAGIVFWKPQQQIPGRQGWSQESHCREARCWSSIKTWQ